MRHASSWTSGSKIKIYTWVELNIKSWFTFCTNCINMILWLTSLGWGNLYNEPGYSSTLLNSYTNEIILNCRRLPPPWEKRWATLLSISFSFFLHLWDMLKFLLDGDEICLSMVIEWYGSCKGTAFDLLNIVQMTSPSCYLGDSVDCESKYTVCPFMETK